MNRAKVLAERKLVLRQKDLTEKTIVIQLGKPYWVVKDQEAACPVAILGLYDDLADAHGVDLFQALELAMQLVNTLLQAAASKQQKLLWPDGETYDISPPKRGLSNKRKRKRTSSPRK